MQAKVTNWKTCEFRKNYEYTTPSAGVNFAWYAQTKHNCKALRGQRRKW